MNAPIWVDGPMHPDLFGEDTPIRVEKPVPDVKVIDDQTYEMFPECT